jgi:hypothetical protein
MPQAAVRHAPRRVLWLTAMLLGAQCATAEELQSFEATYAASGHGLGGTSVVRLTQTGPQEWTYSSTEEPHGILRLLLPAKIVSESRLRIGANGVEPLSYRADDAAGRSSRGVDIHFDWDKGRVSGTDQGQAIDMALQPGVQNDLSVQVALIFQLLHGVTPTGFLLYDKSGIRNYRYSRDSAEELDTPMGKIPTIVYRSQKDGSPRVTRFWCAPSLGFVPLRAEQRRASSDGTSSQEWLLSAVAVKRPATP